MTEPRTRRICVFTGSRADYSPLSPLLRRLRRDDDIDLRVLASGGHLVGEQGLTIRELENDGLTIDERIDMVLAGDSPVAVAKSLGLACIGYGDALNRLEPDLLLVAGDRYEALAATAAALPRLLPVAHIGGGELSYGSTDDQTRHAISKLSHLHFVLTPDACRRLVQMGEDPTKVFQVGPIGLEPSTFDDLMSPESLEGALEFKLQHPLFLITYHPATVNPEGSRQDLHALLEALDKFTDATLVFTAPNVDRGSRAIYQRINDYVAGQHGRAVLTPSLGQRRYLSLLRYSDVLIGNSSSGLTEAPILRTPTINVGSRQDGRSKARSVLDCDANAGDIARAINLALSRADSFFDTIFDPDALTSSLRHVIHLLKTVDLETLIPKRFHDISCSLDNTVDEVMI